jgi:hypothetical protein
MHTRQGVSVSRLFGLGWVEGGLLCVWGRLITSDDSQNNILES